MSVRSCLRGFAAALVLGLALVAQSRDQRTAGVGVRAYIEQIVLPGSELIAAPTSLKAPVAVRVLKVWPHGSLLRYDLEWTGLEAGEHDLAKFLARKDGSPTQDLPPVAVTVTTVLGKGMVEPSELKPQPAQRLHGYTALQIAAGVAWMVGLLAILLVGRRWQRRMGTPPPLPTLADRLRPLVKAVATGSADVGAKAELERLLVAFWRARLDLREARAVDAIVAIREHAEAGALLRQLEAWLHMPTPPAEADWQALLAPYRSVTAASFEPIAAKESR